MSEIIQDGPFAGFQLIHSYSRAEAIEDGELVSLNLLAPDVCAQHYKFPIACTSAVWALIEAACEGCADVNGTVHDLLWMSRVYVVNRPNPQTAIFPCDVMTADNESVTHYFKMVCGAGDNGEPVLTLMLANED